MFSAWGQSTSGEKRENHDEGKAQRQTESVRSRQVEGGALCARHESQSEIGKLMHDFLCSNAAEMYFDILKRQVSQFKNSEEGRRYMCEAMERIRAEGIVEGEARGKAEGKREGKRETMLAMAKRMLKDGILALKDIARYTGLSLAQVKKLQPTVT